MQEGKTRQGERITHILIFTRIKACEPRICKVNIVF